MRGVIERGELELVLGGLALRRLHRDEVTPGIVEIGWLLEELRVATFAQQLGTPKSVSVQRLTKELSALGA